MMRIVLFSLIILFLFSAITVNAIAIQSSTSVHPPQMTQGNTTENTKDFYVVIQSSFPGQSQELSLPLNGTGYIMYPEWTFLFFSDQGNTTYQIYLNGGKVGSGSFIFRAEYSMNVTTDFANVSIILQGSENSTVYNFYDIPILHTTLGKYYTVSNTELPVYTITEYIYFGVRTLVASLFSALGAFFVINRTVVARKKMEVYEK